ncbi:hypothetical protein N7519_005565 [Penicillium mononematosum]|uniref:uncharacterized protein n=1 Tax=Penicillium mononematosum TaxID=268346 RepID=UPI0025468C3B|nr:uncharacterized protein N7519_005565 [Penicillium mononematosum]KAJ6184264.1 hypothetical protein N7519_005565 [Penicillium mononematosum]
MSHAQQRDEVLAQDGIEPMAIIGMSARYPGEASTPAGFWEMLSNGRSAHTEVPADRWNADSWYHPDQDRKGTTNVKTGCFLAEDVSLFDAPFFSMTAQEAAGMDPMQRLMLEVAYESLENAGIPMQSLPGTMTSVYCGCFTGDYGDLANSDIYDAAPYQATGKGKAMLSNRVSWFFDLRGSSFTVDTACSSSLYALHLACQSLRLKESKMAIVGGTNLILTPDMMHSLTAQRFLSPDGVSHSFDARANGYGRGEGIGAIIVKPLRDALADGDTIRAVIRGSGLNQDGRTPGITMPAAAAQADLIRTAYANAGLSMADTGFFQAHGTGTALGDPIELSAIGATFGKARHPDQPPLYVSSIKTNIGHTEGASGLAGVIAAVLSLEQGYIPPNAGWETLNPKLRLDDWRVALPPKCIPWPTEGLRRASVNSFGYGGANAHIIIDDAYNYLTSRNLTGNHQTSVVVGRVQDADSGFNSGEASDNEDYNEDSERQHLFAFSAFDQATLQRMANAYADSIDQHMQSSKRLTPAEELQKMQNRMQDMAHTLATRRTLFSYRSFATASSLEDLVESLRNGLHKFGRVSKADNIIWVFTGQGAQWPTMGRELVSHLAFRTSLEKTQAALVSCGCPWNVFEELNVTSSKRLDSPAFSQPMCTAVQLGLINLMNHWGVQPRAVVGHSSGEIAAAYAAGAISHEDAVKIAYHRGVYSADVGNRQEGLHGGMLAAGISPEEAQPYLDRITEGSATIACYNSPSSVTISGDQNAIVQLEAEIKKDQKFARQLRVQTAYHSVHMNLVADDYKTAMGDIKPLPKSTESVPMFSSVTGALIDPSELGTSYWNMVQPVRFAEAMKSLLSYSPATRSRRRATPIEYSAVVELGPHEALKGPVNQIVSDFNSKLASTLTYTSALRRGQDAQATALEAAGTLWSLGHAVDMTKANNIDEGYTPKALVDLPPYPWNHDKGFWHESYSSKLKRFQKYPRTDLLGAPVHDQNPMAPRWRNILRIPENPWLQDHNIQGSILFPAAGMLAMVIEAAKQIAEDRNSQGFELRNVRFDRGLVIPSAEQSIETTLHLHPLDAEEAVNASWYNFQLFSCSPAGSWTEHSSGTVRIMWEGNEDAENKSDWTLCQAKYSEIQKISTQTSVRAFYNGLDAVGMHYGSSFKNMTEAHAHGPTRSAHGTITIPDTKSIMPNQFEFPHIIHPATLDAMFHLLFVGDTGGNPMREAFVPVSLERMFVSSAIPSTAGVDLKGYTQCRSKTQRETVGTVAMSTADFAQPGLIIEGFVAREVSSSTGAVEPMNSMSESQAPKRTGHLHWSEDISHWKGDAVVNSLQQAITDQSLSATEQVTAQISVWLERLCHKEAEPNVLVIGSELADVVRQYAPIAGRRFCFRKCTVAAPAQDELDSLKQALSDKAYEVEYIKLDLGEESVPDMSPFDLILSSTTPQPGLDLGASLQSIRSLLHPTGRILLGGPNVELAGVSAWNDILASAGLNSSQAYHRTAKATVVISSLEVDDEKPEEVVILKAPQMTPALEILKTNIESVVQSQGIAVSTVSLEDSDSFVGKWIISLVEVEEPFIMGWSDEDLQHFQTLATSAEYVLWLTRGGQLLDSSNIDWSLTTGLLRTLRVEMAKLSIPHLDLSPALDLTSARAVEVIMSCFNASSPNKSYEPEMEYAEKDGTIFIPRFKTNNSFDHEIDRHSARSKSLMQVLHDQDRALKISTSKTGQLNDLRWIDDELATTALSENDVEIKTQYVGLEQADVNVAKGSSQCTTVGRQVGGIVTRVGASVTRFQIGQKVVAVRPEACRMYARQSQDFVQPVPEHMSLVDAVAAFRAYVTAYYALVNLAHIQCSESILIHGAGGEVGQAAIQLSRYLGAKTYVTVGSEEERETITQMYSIPEERVFRSQSGTLSQSVLRAVHGDGVDVVLSLVDDDVAPQERLCVGEFGRFVGLGGRDYSSYSSLSTARQTNVVFANLDMEVVEERRPRLVSDILTKVEALLNADLIKCISNAQIYPACNVEQALYAVEKRTAMGKVILDLTTDSPVPIILPRPVALRLDPEATYILSGGLGGLGPSVAEMMISHGARHLVFLSRSGPKSADAQEHLRRLSGLGCNAEAFACDIGTLSSVESVQQLGAQNGWKIRGVVQCAMVLRDSTFENMTHQKWTESIQPKIHGSWNLHRVFGGQPLDFFIMLSSVSGIIGNPAQGNYTAGNTYQDGLALYRRQRGLPGTALAVGAVMDVGAFADNSYFENFLEKFEHLASLTVKIEEVMIILQTLMKGQTEDGVAVPPLLAMGFTEQLKRDGNITSLWPKDRKFDHRIELPENGDDNTGGDKVRLADLLARVTDLTEAGEVVEQALKANLANAMTASPEDVDADKPLHSYGVDSLKAVEVRNWLFRELKCDISVFDILSPMSLAKLSVNIAEKSKFLPESVKRTDQLE